MRESGENYLEAILIIRNETGYVKAVDVAKKLRVSKPSVSRAVSILKKLGYVKTTNALNIELTDSGLKIAQAVYSRHLFLTEFFIKIGVGKSVAEMDACRAEHILSNETYQKLRTFYNSVKDKL